MTDRTPRLHLVATLTVWGSTELSGNEKIVWYHTWLLDLTPPDGCYMSSKSMAERVGLSSKTVEDIRARLLSIGLLEKFKRHGTVQPGWVATLGAALVPQSRELRRAVVEAPPLARQLDERIRSHQSWTTRKRTEQGSAPARETAPRDDGGRFRPSTEESSVRARSVSVGLGEVGGGTPTSASTDQRPLTPAVTGPEKQMGVGAHAPEGQEEDAPEPRAIDERPRREVEDEGWANLREKLARKRAVGE